MQFNLTNLSFDFGQKRANASLNASDPGYASLIISVPFQPPASVSADALEDHLLDEIRKAITDAASFSSVKKSCSSWQVRRSTTLSSTSASC